MSRTAVIVARAVFALFWLLTSAYCVMAFIPFTYVEVIQFAFVPSLNLFAKLHPFLYWIALAAAMFTLRDDLRRPTTRRWVIPFVVVSIAGGIALGLRPVLVSLVNDESSLRLAFVALVPLLWLALIDVVGHAGHVSFAPEAGGNEGRLFHTSWMTAVFLSVMYFGGAIVRFTGDVSIGIAAASLASHLVVFMGVFAMIVLVRSLAAVLPSPARAELILISASAAAALSATTVHLVLGALSLTLRPGIAVAMAVTVVASHVGLACRLAVAGGRSAESGLDFFLAPLQPGTGRLVRAQILGSLAAGGIALASVTSAMDWNFLLQKGSALVIGVLVFATIHAMSPFDRARPRHVALYLAAAVLALIAFKGLDASGHLDRSAVLDRYAGHDPSFKVVRDLLRRPQSASRDDSAFFRYLEEHTNIARSVHIVPANVQIVPQIEPVREDKPNIFIMVIDSLRSDYLSPYNRRVTFTPSLGEFARDSVVFTRAFTRYGGTGLSEPSIWTGGMMPHQQYITPFHPMNGLEKLTEAHGYRDFVSLDTILRLILKPDPSLVEIDRNVQTRDLTLSTSLTDLASLLRAEEAKGQPVFAYVQPQDLHISTITRQNGSVSAGETYPGFYAPYASRLRRADAAFGEFIAALHDMKLYDDSIVIVTSDHGDSLGEDGRWGHAYTIYPEILRVPLIVHLPPALRARMVADPNVLAFTTDITPTLYALLGQEPVLKNDIFGKTLFAATRRELASAERVEGKFLVASSYGPVYGILGDNGQSLYIADGVNYREYLYDLSAVPGAPSAVLDEPQRDAYRKLVRDGIDAIHAFYRVH